MSDLRFSLEEKTEKSLKLVADYCHNTSPNERSYLNKYLAKLGELPSRTIQNSYIEGIIELSSKETLRKKYTTSFGHVRIGRLLEDMDMFAIFVAKIYISYPNVPDDVPSPYVLVTVYIDQIDFTDFIPKTNVDIKLSGHVTWVGKSTIEVIVWLEQFSENCWHKINSAIFLIAARDSTCTKAAFVNPLITTNEYEKRVLEGGIFRKDERKKKFFNHISKNIPTIEEQKLIHELHLATKSKIGKSDFIPMNMCAISNSIISHLEDKNSQNTVFGGFIMRKATELAWFLGFKFTKVLPVLKHTSDVTFFTPVVNYLIQMDAQIVYTTSHFYQINVIVRVIDPDSNELNETNTFHYTFKSSNEINQVYPKSYAEAMMYIDGKKHFDTVMSGCKMKYFDNDSNRYISKNCKL